MNVALKTICAAVLAGIAQLAPANTAAAIDAVPLAPHRAVYDFMLADTSAGSGIAGLTGRMVYELNGSACEGYTQNMRFVTVMTNQEGVETVNDLSNSSWEEPRGAKLRFSFNQFQNDTSAEVSQGDATRAKNGGKVLVDVAKPARKRVKIPAETYFPMQHARALIASARAGRTLLKGYLFDGSEKGEKYYLTNAVIGKSGGNGGKALPASLKNPGRLSAIASWPVTISYFEVGKDHEDSTPSYELHFRYFENGVTADLSIDYGEFSIRGELKELTFLDAGKCVPAAQ